jgi:hypothetical protein
MSRKCPFCNWEVENNRCTNPHGACSYKGPGLTQQEIAEQARGFQLGDITGPSSRNNGAGCYDHDEDFSR